MRHKERVPRGMLELSRAVERAISDDDPITDIDTDKARALLATVRGYEDEIRDLRQQLARWDVRTINGRPADTDSGIVGIRIRKTKSGAVADELYMNYSGVDDDARRILLRATEAFVDVVTTWMT